MSPRPYLALKIVSFTWKSDVRENERINKMLKLFWQRTPNGTRELCSARAGLRFQLGPAQNECMQGRALKWSTVKPAVESLSEKLMTGWGEKDDVLSAADRWAPAEIPQDHPSEESVKNLLPKLNPQWCET